MEQVVLKAIAKETSPDEILRAMLVPSSLGPPKADDWFVVAANPLSWRRNYWQAEGGYPTIRRTSSDYVGVRDILQSFGLLFGFYALPDNINPEDFHDDVLEESPMNIYCIGSPKANRWTHSLLSQYHQRLKLYPQLKFCPNPKSTNLRNPKVIIRKDDGELKPGGWDARPGNDQYERDFGIIVRGPNPFHPDHMIAILAGRGSLGTEAACRAFTTPARIEEILNKLPRSFKPENHKDAFWALVSMKRIIDKVKDEADINSLLIEEAHTFSHK